MGVFIEGMGMPITCCHCPLMGYGPEIEWNDGGRETQGAYICVITHELIDNTKREEHCPLIPAADVRPVVLCKDCKWYEINELKKDGTEDRRYKPSVCMLAEQRRKPNHFCADGEKREGS